MSRFREDQNLIPASGTKILLFTVIDGHPAEVQLSMKAKDRARARDDSFLGAG